MEEDKHDICEKYMAQGCKYLAGKCPCKMFTEESEFQKYTRKHWKSVVLCDECKNLVKVFNKYYCAECEELIIDNPSTFYCAKGERK